MRRIAPHNRLDVIAGSFRFLQDVSQEELRDRIIDLILNPGIFPTPSATADEIAAGLPNDTFTVINNGPSAIDVGLGTAYTARGERIEIPSDDAVDFDENAPLFTTTGVDGRTIGAIAPFITPFSTGRIDIPDPDATNAKGETADAGVNRFTRYVFISYESVVRTVSLAELTPSSPDHQDDATGTFAVGSPNRRKPMTSKDRKVGTVFVHQFVNGYRIYIARLSEVIFSGGAVGTPILGNLTNHPSNEGIDPVNTALVDPNKNPFVNVANATYLGKYVWDSGVAQIVGAPVVDNTGNDNPRKILQFKSVEVAAVGDNTVDPKIVTTVYAANQIVTLQDHTSALGTGIVTPENPHGLAVTNLTAGFATPDNIVYQEESNGDGFFDRGGGENSQLETSALECTVLNTTLVLTGFVTFARPKDVGSSRTIDLTGSSEARVELSQLTNDQSLYINGFRIETVNPKLDDVSAGLGVDAFVPFFDSDAEGTYVVFITPDLDNAGVGIIGKEIVPPGTAIEAVLGTDRLPLLTVFWNKSVTGSDPNRLQRTIFDSTEDCIDLRNLGLITKKQISTEAFIDARKGMLALSVFENLVSNGDFAIATTEGEADVNTDPPASWVAVSGANGNIALVITTNTPETEPTAEEGPRSVTVAKASCTTPNGQVYETKITSPTPELKPNTVYSASVWIKILNPSTNNLSILSQFGNLAGTVSYTVGGIKLLALDRASAAWQRVAISLKTNSSLDPSIIDPLNASVAVLEIHFQNLDQNNTPFDPSEFLIGDVVIVEGDWTVGFVSPKTYPGEIFMWDKTTTCPPGSIEIAILQGKMPIGATGAGPLLVGANSGTSQTDFTQDTSGPVNLAGKTSSVTPATIDNLQHQHGAASVLTTSVDAPDGGFPVWEEKAAPNIHSTNARSLANINANANLQHEHDINDSFTLTSLTLAQYALIFCRRL